MRFAAYSWVVILLCGMMSPAASAGQVLEVPERDSALWWQWSNPPAINFEAESKFSIDEGAPVFEVEFAYTINSDGAISQCEVVRKSDPRFDDAGLCDLIVLHEYVPGKLNPSGLPVRTRFTLLMGVQPDQARKLVSKNTPHN